MILLLPFLLPLAAYLFVLGLVNRRWHPLVAAGTWDFAGVLFAASGILMFGGPALLTSFSESWRDFWLVGQAPAPSLFGEHNWIFWSGLSLAYFLAVVAGAAVLLRRRRNTTVVYNVDPAVFDDLLAQALEGMGLSWSRAGNNVVLAPADAKASGFAAARLSPAGPDRVAVVEVEPFPAMYHVTLRWETSDDGFRQEVEAALARTLGRVHTADNPVGGWFMLTSGFLMAVIFFDLFALFLLHFVERLPG